MSDTISAGSGAEDDGQGWIVPELDAAAAEWEQMPDEYKPVIVADYWANQASLRVVVRLGSLDSSGRYRRRRVTGTTEGREGRANLWHRAYCRWYDHDRAGHRIRAAAWGWVADRLVRFG